MAYRYLFCDSDILLDLLLKRDPFYYYVQALLIESEKQDLILNTSALAIANVNYILCKEIGAPEARKKIRNLTRIIKILPFESSAVELAIDSRFLDLEDAFQYFIAKKNDCDIILTRNIKDYKQATIPVLTADQFLRTL